MGGRAPHFFLLFALTACGGSGPDVPRDRTLDSAMRSGGAAFELERPAEAAEQFRAARQRALARDDVVALGDAGFNIAVAELAANRPRQALAAARQGRADLARRGQPATPALLLVEATALYRLGDRPAAARLAEEARAGSDAEVSTRAAFLRGLIADEAGDRATLTAMAAQLAAATEPAFRADAEELRARVGLREARLEVAATAAEAAEGLRRETLDYRGLARVLRLRAEIADRAGDPRAPTFYLRAGESAAAQGETGQARTLLRRAAANPATREEANRRLRALPASGG